LNPPFALLQRRSMQSLIYPKILRPHQPLHKLHPSLFRLKRNRAELPKFRAAKHNSVLSGSEKK
jgi:hypothetical protein